jgi:uncharacterized protein (DUF58 family)
MIIPRNKLIGWMALVAGPLSLVAAMAPHLLFLCTFAIVILLLIAALDALRAYRSIEELTIELTPVVRLSKDRSGAIGLKITNSRKDHRALRLGLPFPREVQSPQEDLAVELPVDVLDSQLQWNITARRRGQYPIRTIFLEGISPWGLWSARGKQPVDSEIRVYPNLMRERKNLAALFLNRGAFGVHAQRQVGKGREFEKLREYVSGDSFEDIHWKATARRAKPITKVFQIEKTQEIYIMIDASRLSGRRGEGTATPNPPGAALEEESYLERYVTAALVLGLAAEQQGDLFGLATFSDKVESFVRAKNGKAHYQTCRDALYTLHTREASPDFDEIATFIRHKLRRRALLFFLTSLDDPVLAESFVRNMDLLSKQQLVLVNLIKPRAAAPLFSNPEVNSMDDLYRQLHGHLRWHSLRELEKVLQRRGVKLSLVENEKLSVELVSQYLSVKRRQLI